LQLNGTGDEKVERWKRQGEGGKEGNQQHPEAVSWKVGSTVPILLLSQSLSLNEAAAQGCMLLLSALRGEFSGQNVLFLFGAN